MSEERKGISLRTKRKVRPTGISTPKKISGPIQQSSINGSSRDDSRSFETPVSRPQTSEKTSDLVKRRYSTRFNNLPADFDASVPPMPNMPSIPKQFVPPKSRARDISPGPRSATLAVDLAALRDPRLKPEQYVASLLTDASDQDISDYQHALRKMKNRTSTDLQQNVYQNRTQFIKISKEAEKLKGEMRVLRNLMSELKANTTALRAASSAGSGDVSASEDFYPSSLSKRDKRSSVADRTALWNSQLQALWKNVEGSQKFLPAAPGRHVIQNAGPWIELDNATWKSRRSMQIFLLNDHLLVASRKKRKLDPRDPNMNPEDARSATAKLVADRCWALMDIEIVDIAGTDKSSSARNKIADAIMVRGLGQESFTYRTEKADDSEKGKLLLNFRKAVEELRRGQRSEIESSNKTKEAINYFATRDPGLLKKTDLLENISGKDRPSMLIEVDGKQQNLRWIESQVDELDMDIALQRFEAAVSKVEKLSNLAKGLKNNQIAQDFIRFKADERASKLAELITRELVDTHNETKKTRRNITWLTRLGFEDRARDAYLEARGQTIQRRSRQCIFSGNLHNYIWELSFVHFAILRKTVADFQACFPAPRMSACVKWAKEQVDAFNALLLRQLSSARPGSAVYEDCMEQAREHAKMLALVGMDFVGLIGRPPIAGGAGVSAAPSPLPPAGLGLS